MYTTVLVLLVYLSLAGHEFGHLITGQNNGVKILEFGIGFPKGPRISYVPKTGRYAGIRFSFYVLTWFLGGFVRDADNGFENLAYRKKAFVACAGPFANIHFGCFLLILVFVFSLSPYLDVMMKWGVSEWALFIPSYIGSSPYLWGSMLFIPLCWFGRKFISVYLGPVLGITLFVWLFSSIHHVGAVNYFSHLMGPIGVVSDLSSMTNNMYDAILLAGQLSIGLGALNLLPIPPLDGGYLFLPAIERVSHRLANYYRKIGLALLVFVMVFALFKDIIMLFSA